MNEWDGLLNAKRLRHTLPPTHVQKNVNEDVGAGATMASPLLLLRHPYLCPSLLQTGAWRSCDLTIKPPTQHTHGLTLTHTYIRGTCVHIFLYLARLCHGSPAWIHIALHALTWQSPPPPPHCCRSVNEQLQSGGRFNHTGT